MRKQRQDIKLLQEGGANEEDLLSVRSRYRATMAEYVDFSDKMGLPQQIDRINGDGLKGVNKSAKLKSAFENGIIKVQKTKKRAILIQ